VTKLRLAYAGYSYLDRTRALELGTVSPAGIELNVQRVDITELFRRAARFAEWDTCEMSVSTYLMMVADGDDTLVGLPVFPSRAFRHNMIWVHADAGIASPEDLRGKRVGLPEYQMTAGLWIRAFLEHDHGVRPSDVDWWYGGMYTPSYRERRVHAPPAGVSVRRIPSDRALFEMFESGELDALISFDPAPLKEREPRVRRLFPDYRAVEEDYFRRTGLFPIMHLVVVRRDVYEANRWVAASLLEAFVESKRVGLERLRDVNALAVSLPWVEDDVDRAERLFGGDPFRYGFEQNRPVLEAMTRYAHEQGLTARKLEPEELFAPETIEHPGDDLLPRPRTLD
jgi:4,5-dihydroxyphthalate decarboxylase